jgi:A/G-specific adenine glycosylase
MTTPPPPAVGRVRRLQRGLLAWYRTSARPLAWRRTRDPYRILVSEVMLQQTQAARAEPAWEAFCARFPDAPSLAAAPLADVLTMWRGLGYNRRAVSLHRAAQVVVAEHGGALPDDLDALRGLPGVGPYTARAVLAFAFGRDVAPVDVNVARVLSRAVVAAPLTPAAAQRVADEVVPRGDGPGWSQALMDLGARVCTARTPRCDACPVAAACAWRSGGGEDPAARSSLRSRPQAAFAGSDRYHRGRLVDALRRGAVAAEDLPTAADLADTGRLAGITDGLVADGLAEWSQGLLRLPR